jgi:hypothetical protein
MEDGFEQKFIQRFPTFLRRQTDRTIHWIEIMPPIRQVKNKQSFQSSTGDHGLLFGAPLISSQPFSNLQRAFVI